MLYTFFENSHTRDNSGPELPLYQRLRRDPLPPGGYLFFLLLSKNLMLVNIRGVPFTAQRNISPSPQTARVIRCLSPCRPAASCNICPPSHIPANALCVSPSLRCPGSAIREKRGCVRRRDNRSRRTLRNGRPRATRSRSPHRRSRLYARSRRGCWCEAHDHRAPAAKEKSGILRVFRRTAALVVVVLFFWFSLCFCGWFVFLCC